MPLLPQFLFLPKDNMFSLYPTSVYCDLTYGEMYSHGLHSEFSQRVIDNSKSIEVEAKANEPTSEGQDPKLAQTEDASRVPGVLIIEDSTLLRAALSIGFQDRGFDIWLAADGEEGVAVYQKFWPLIDVVLSDVQMPILDGSGTLEALREINPLVCLCFMTGDVRKDRRNGLLQHGALRVFMKPFSSVAEIVEELWDLATTPQCFAAESDSNCAKTIGPDCSVHETYLVETTVEKDLDLIKRVYSLLLTSISRVGSMLRRPPLRFGGEQPKPVAPRTNQAKCANSGSEQCCAKECERCARL